MDEAKAHIRTGVPFGDVFPLVPEGEQEAFRHWYVKQEGVPNLAKRNAATVPSGDLCRCGGLMVRTGTCLTCQSCGESSGGCG